MKNSITQLFNIRYPIIQAGMVWASGWKLASAVSNSGGLGLIGSGSMYPEMLREHIRKCKKATKKPFGVNIPLLYQDIDLLMKVIVEENVPIIFTAAGNPEIWTEYLKNENRIVVHVVSSVKFALKAQESGVDALVAEGFEAGGHNGREETTTMTLIPIVKKVIKIPLIAAGGIASGKSFVIKYLKSLKLPTHESDKLISSLYRNPSAAFLNHLKKIGFENFITKQNIKKNKIREIVFTNKKKRKAL